MSAWSSEKSSEKMSEKMSGKTPDQIIALLKEDNSLTIAVLAEKIGLSTRAVEKNLKKLQDSGHLKRKGGDKGGYWEVIHE